MKSVGSILDHGLCRRSWVSEPSAAPYGALTPPPECEQQNKSTCGRGCKSTKSLLRYLQSNSDMRSSCDPVITHNPRHNPNMSVTEPVMTRKHATQRPAICHSATGPVSISEIFLRYTEIFLFQKHPPWIRRVGFQIWLSGILKSHRTKQCLQ